MCLTMMLFKNLCLLSILTCAAAGRDFMDYVEPQQPLNITLTEIKNPDFAPTPVSTIEIYAAPFLKYGSPMPPQLAAAWETFQDTVTDSGSIINARDIGQTMNGTDHEYVFPVQIGTPAQTLHVALDTASTDLWVWSWLSPGSHPNYYDAARSSTAVEYTGQTWALNDTTGLTKGVVWLDTFVVDIISVAGNPIECATSVNPGYTNDSGIDGVLGLDLEPNDSESPQPQQTWLNYVMPFLNQSVFTMALVSGGPGSVDFGFINSTKYSGNIAYAPVVQVEGYPQSWNFVWSGYAIGNKTFQVENRLVMTDTSGSTIGLPPAMAASYYSQVTGAYQGSDGSWFFPCSSQLPTFTFGIGNTRFVIPSKAFMLGIVSSDTNLASSNCVGFGAIQPGSPLGTTNIVYFSLPFYYGLFIVHDYEGRRLGFANRTSY